MDLARELALIAKLEDAHFFNTAIDCRVARTRKELEGAYALVYKEYLKRGYTEAQQTGLRYSLYNALPEAATFIVTTAEKAIVATATVIPDSPLGLPIDDICKTEIDGMRQQGMKVCEITMLASDTGLAQRAPLSLSLRKTHFILAFFKVLLDYVRDHLHYQVMCASVNPRYRVTFEAILFRRICDIERYQYANGAPALGMYLDVSCVNAQFSRPGREPLYKIFVEQNTPENVFTNKAVMTPRDLRYFFIEKSDAFARAEHSHLDYLQAAYHFNNYASVFQ